MSPARALKLFVEAMYGHSMNEAFCPSPDVRGRGPPRGQDPTIDIREAKDLYWFGHKYNIGQMDAAVSKIITSHLDELQDSETDDVIDFYNSIPEGSPAVQDAIFKVMLMFQARFSLCIMRTGIHISPRHVNALLETLGANPTYMLQNLQDCIRLQVICPVNCIPFCHAIIELCQR